MPNLKQEIEDILKETPILTDEDLVKLYASCRKGLQKELYLQEILRKMRKD